MNLSDPDEIRALATRLMLVPDWTVYGIVFADNADRIAQLAQEHGITEVTAGTLDQLLDLVEDTRES